MAQHQPSDAPPKPYPLLIFPRDATQAGVELQVLLGCQLVEERIELWAVAQALLHLQELLQDAAERTEGPQGEGITVCPHTIFPFENTCCSSSFHMPLYCSILFQVNRNWQPWPRATVTCHTTDKGQPSRTQGCSPTQASFSWETPKQAPSHPVRLCPCTCAH